MGDGLNLGLAGLMIAIVAWAIFVIRKLMRAELRARHRVHELEARLNEVESAFSAEAHVMLIWQAREKLPQRLLGSLYGTVKIPSTIAEILEFHQWLEPDSATLISESVKLLRDQGKAFNFGIKTQRNELLEVDGRAAGGQATVRFRPLSGEREQITELSYDARKLAFQVGRLSTILDAAPFPIWLCGGEQQLVWVNQAYVKLVEAADSDQVLRTQLQISTVQALDVSRADPSLGLVGRTHCVTQGLMQAFNIYEVALPEGNAGFALNVSALEDVEKELDRHIKAHASTLNKLTTAIVIFGADQRLKFYNTAYAKLWPLPDEWLTTHPTDGEILDRLREQRCLPEQANYREWRARQLSTYTTLDIQENWWYLPDGRSLHVVCEQHPFGGVTYLYENVTREIQLESRYNELIGVQQETLDNLDEAIALFGSDGRLKLFNPAFSRFWHFEAQDLLNEPHIDQIAASDFAHRTSPQEWQDIKYSVTDLESERRVLTGRIAISDLILQYNTAPLPDGHTLLTFSDISAPAHMEQALRERTEALEAADRLKNTFLSNVSYEVRTPLTSILGFSETLELGLMGPLNPRQQDYILDIRRSSEDLKKIIDAIIDLSAIDAGAFELNLQNFEVSHILENAAQKVGPLMQARDQLLKIELAQGDLRMVGDAQRIEQIVANLLSNAIGFSAPRSQIRMGAKVSGHMMQIWVADSGRGIEPDFQKKVFDRFQTKPLAGSHRGPGLGLAIVKSFTELHGGKVSLVSKLGQGTTVVCNFPLQGPPKLHYDDMFHLNLQQRAS